MKQTKLYLIACLITLAFSAGAKEYFMSVTGNDNLHGTKDSPFRSIFKASETAMPGDTITILGG